jgi:hypothetical protein
MAMFNSYVKIPEGIYDYNMYIRIRILTLENIISHLGRGRNGVVTQVVSYGNHPNRVVFFPVHGAPPSQKKKDRYKATVGSWGLL